MRILSLHPYIPHPLNSGGILRSHHTLAALVDEHEVTFAAQWRNGEDVSDWDLARRFAAVPVLVPCAADRSVNPARERLRSGAPKAWFGHPQSIRGHDCDSFWEALAGLPLDSYDAVH